MTLRLVVLLLVVAFLLHRFAPRRRLPWSIPIVVVVVLVTVRTVTWLAAD